MKSYIFDYHRTPLVSGITGPNPVSSYVEVILRLIENKLIMNAAIQRKLYSEDIQFLINATSFHESTHTSIVFYHKRFT